LDVATKLVFFFQSALKSRSNHEHFPAFYGLRAATEAKARKAGWNNKRE
jgi:hypothetical protein